VPFGVVLAEQLGMPVPAVPFLVAAGALAGMGKLDLAGALALAVLACLVSDLAWYEAGRRRGGSVLQFLCRISLEPDSCVRRTENTFARHRARTLLVAKFVPGLSTVAPPLAGIIGMSRRTFLLCDAAGSLLWAGTFAGLGYVFSRQVERAAEWAVRVGGGLTAVMATGLALYVGWKYVERARALRSLRVARITAEELKRRMDAGEDLMVMDLRHPLDLEADPARIPGAVHFALADLEARHHEIPLDRDVVLYCT